MRRGGWLVFQNLLNIVESHSSNSPSIQVQKYCCQLTCSPGFRIHSSGSILWAVTKVRLVQVHQPVVVNILSTPTILLSTENIFQFSINFCLFDWFLSRRGIVVISYPLDPFIHHERAPSNHIKSPVVVAHSRWGINHNWRAEGDEILKPTSWMWWIPVLHSGCHLSGWNESPVVKARSKGKPSAADAAVCLSV